VSNKKQETRRIIEQEIEEHLQAKSDEFSDFYGDWPYGDGTFDIFPSIPEPVSNTDFSESEQRAYSEALWADWGDHPEFRQGFLDDMEIDWGEHSLQKFCEELNDEFLRTLQDGQLS